MGNGIGRTGVAVYWNVESCAIPKNIEYSSIRQRIEATLEQYGYCGPLTIRAYGKLEYHTKKALTTAGIDVIKFKRAKDNAEKYMLVDISNWVSGIHCPATCMLISEDLSFSHLVDMLRHRGLNFLLSHPNPTASKLCGAAKHVWGWPKLELDEKPLPMDEACASLAGDNSISNLSSHPNSDDDQDIGFSILMTLIILCYGICSQLGLISHHEILGFLFVMGVLTIILNESEIINVFGRRESLPGGLGLFKIVGGIRRSFIQDIGILGLIRFLAYVIENLGLPTILRLPLALLLLYEFVKWFLRFAGPLILVIWDFENCHPPKEVDHYSISRNIRVCLENHGYLGLVVMRAYGDTKSLDLGAFSKEIDVIHVNPGKDAADKRIMVDLPFLARANMFGGTFMLISGDSDFVRPVRLLVQGGLKFLHCSPNQGVRAFHSLGKKVLDWPDIVTQLPSQPLLMSAASASHPVVPDKHSDQGVWFIMIATVLFVGASKRLRLISYPDYADVILVLQMWIIMLDDLGIVNVFGRKCRSTKKSQNAGVPNRSLTEATWVLSLICAFLCCLEANKRLELWLLPEGVNFLLHCLLLAFIEQYFGVLKFFSLRV